MCWGKRRSRPLAFDFARFHLSVECASVPDQGSGTRSEGLKAATEVAKQIITLSTAAVAFTVTFVDKFLPAGEVFASPTALFISWALFAVAVVAGLWSLMAIHGSLDALDRQANGWTMTADQQKAAMGDFGHWRLPATVAILAFIGGLIAMIVAGAHAMPHAASP
jgi:hypothetical protein